MHLAPLIQDLAVLLGLAAMVAFIFQRLNQPVVVGYILAGALLGPSSLLPSPIFDLPNITVWGELGVIFLMFHLGLEFSFRRFERLGFKVGFMGLLEIAIMFMFGWWFAKAVGFQNHDPLFLGAMVSVSSTTIIVKAFDELKLKTRRFAESVFGILVVEDLAAIVMLVVLNTIATDSRMDGTRLLTLVPIFVAELILVIGGWFTIGVFIVPRFVRRVGQSQNEEILTLLAVGLCLILAVVAAQFHYSMALGAFIMGSIISETREADRIRSLVHPLRDLFGAVFFITVGMMVDAREIVQHPGLIVALTFLVIAGKLIAVFIASSLSGQPFRHSVRVAMSMGQIGEFSFIIAAVGLVSGLMSRELQPVIVSVSIVTTFLTPYLIRSSDKVSHALFNRLPRPVRERIEAYPAWVTLRSTFPIVPAWMRLGFARFALNAIVVGVIFTATHRWLAPWLGSGIRDATLLQILSFMAAIAGSAPFIFAMLSTARQRLFTSRILTQTESSLRGFFFVLLTILWLGVFSLQLISALAAAAITAILTLGLYSMFYRRLAFSYAWFERGFIASLKRPEPESPTQRAMQKLAPWDAHLVKITVHPNSPLVGLSLSSGGLRRDHGVNLIAIRRGEHVIAIPKSSELILPFDELLVLGTDEQIDAARPSLEDPAVKASEVAELDDYDMRIFLVASDSPLVGQCLRESGIRENFGGLVVGVERDGRRHMNPPAEFKIRAEDLLWITGDRDGIKRLT
jgi:CPA2 family monovalent cation:H+ antiporter-2